MKTDVKAATMTVSGTVYGARTRVRGVVVMPTEGTAVVALSDGVNPAMTFTSAIAMSVPIAEDGVLFSTSVEITLTNATAVVFYG